MSVGEWVGIAGIALSTSGGLASFLLARMREQSERLRSLERDQAVSQAQSETVRELLCEVRSEIQRLRDR